MFEANLLGAGLKAIFDVRAENIRIGPLSDAVFFESSQIINAAVEMIPEVELETVKKTVLHKTVSV